MFEKHLILSLQDNIVTMMKNVLKWEKEKAMNQG